MNNKKSFEEKIRLEIEMLYNLIAFFTSLLSSHPFSIVEIYNSDDAWQLS